MFNKKRAISKEAKNVFDKSEYLLLVKSLRK